MKSTVMFTPAQKNRAELYNAEGIKIGSCTDTKPAIAKALMELPLAHQVRNVYGWTFRSDYGYLMNSHNNANSGLTRES